MFARGPGDRRNEFAARIQKALARLFGPNERIRDLTRERVPPHGEARAGVGTHARDRGLGAPPRTDPGEGVRGRGA